MNANECNSCLVNMPELVLEKIMSTIHNPSNVSRTCKYLYEFVCGMEKRRCVMYISAFDATSPLNIDADAVFDSILNTHRTVEEIELRMERLEDLVDSSYELNARQLERISAIMKQFGTNVTSLKLRRFVLTSNFILELLQQTPNLESLSFIRGKAMGSVMGNPPMSLQLPSLEALEIIRFPGLFDIVNLIPDRSLKLFHYTDQRTVSTDVLITILTRQHNIKCLTVGAALSALRFDHLQLETLIVNSFALDDNSQLVQLLKCQTNLKELKLINYSCLSPSSFQWICNNLKKLEVFEVREMHSIEGNPFEMLDELKQLRHFRPSDARYLFDNGFEPFQFKSDSIEKLEFGFSPTFSCGERLTKMVNSIAHNLTNLTHLQMKFRNFSALLFVLGHCTKIIHLTGCLNYPHTDQLTDQRFPNIQHLVLCDDSSSVCITLSQSMTLLARAMPNLKSMSLLSRCGFKFDVKTMKEFIKESKSLEYFYVNHFELHRKVSRDSTDDVVETIRCLTDQLKGYHIEFFSHMYWAVELSFLQIKNILCNDFYVRHEHWNRPDFYLCKGGEKKLVLHEIFGLNKTF